MTIFEWFVYLCIVSAAVAAIGALLWIGIWFSFIGAVCGGIGSGDTK
ncbi:hypothetical protein [Polaromonas sp. YR568]